jgi:hypothetical protein
MGRRKRPASGIFHGKATARPARPLDFRSDDPIFLRMNYLLALLVPPLSIVLTGRVILGILVLPIWLLALIFSGGLTHPMFILLAWLLIFQSRERSATRE